MPVLGERFRAAREARGLTLTAISEQIRIRSVYLAAIEDDNWSAIGAPVYVRGFLRTYARFLGLDPEEQVAEFNRASSTAPLSRPPAEPTQPDRYAPVEEPLERPRRGGRVLIWLAGVIAVALVAFVVYNEMTPPQRSVAVATSPLASAPLGAVASPESSAAPTGAPAPSAAPAIGATAATSAVPGASGSPLPGASPGVVPSVSPGARSLAVVLSATSWLRVTVDGSVSMEGTFPAGTSRTFHGKTALVRIGNAGGVQVIVDGKSLGTLGKSGDVVDRSFVL